MTRSRTSNLNLLTVTGRTDKEGEKLGIGRGINEIASAMCRGVDCPAVGIIPQTRNVTVILIWRQRLFTLQIPLNSCHCIVAQPSPTGVSISGPERDGLSGPPHRACHVAGAFALASC